MNYYRIYLSASDSQHELTVTADSLEEALDNARSLTCLECFMTETAYAERVEE
jgi:hypothetical protein